MRKYFIDFTESNDDDRQIHIAIAGLFSTFSTILLDLFPSPILHLPPALHVSRFLVVLKLVPTVLGWR